MSKITVALLILFSLHSQAQSEGDGGDPNMAPGGYSGVKQGAGTQIDCMSGECEPSANKKYKEVKGHAQSIEDATKAVVKENWADSSGKQKEESISDVVKMRRIQPEDAALSKEEIEENRRKAISTGLNRAETDATADKIKKGMELREGFSGGESSVGGVKYKTKVAPTRGGIKVRIKGQF